MKRNKSFIYTFISAAVISVLIIGYLYGTSVTQIDIINITFMVGLLYLIAGTVFFLVQRGSYDGIVYSFRRFFRGATRSGEMIREVTPDDPDEESNLYKERSYGITYPLMLTGAIFFIVTVLIGFMI